MPISMLWSGLVRVRENDGRTNDDREKDVVPLSALRLFPLFTNEETTNSRIKSNSERDFNYLQKLAEKMYRSNVSWFAKISLISVTLIGLLNVNKYVGNVHPIVKYFILS